MTYDVIDNFLPEYQFKQLQTAILSWKFPWYYNDMILPEHIGKELMHQYIHVLYNLNPPWHGGTQYLENSDMIINILELCGSILGATRLHRIKANTRLKTLFHRGAGYHVDIPNCSNLTTSILYMNTNNGYTKFKKGGKVKSVENRMVIFDGNVEHQGYSCTDKLTRVLINFNYER